LLTFRRPIEAVRFVPEARIPPSVQGDEWDARALAVSAALSIEERQEARTPFAADQVRAAWVRAADALRPPPLEPLSTWLEFTDDTALCRHAL